jgi:peptidyl-prolyl cis-trans isomerase C
MKLSTQHIFSFGFVLSQAIAVGIILTSSPATAQETKGAAEQQVVAEVNQIKISKHQLELELNRQLQQELSYYDQSQRQLLRKKLLSRMVERELLLQAARSAGFTPSEQDLSSFMQSLKRGFPNNGSFLSELEKHGIDENTFTSGIRDDLTIKNYVQQTIFAGINIDDREAEEAFRKSPEDYRLPEEIHVRHILLKVTDEAGQEKVSQVEQLARQIAAEAKAGNVDFGFLAKKYSEAPNSGQGGDLGFVTRNQLDQHFSDAAFSLDPGNISDPVRTRFGFHIIKVEEKRGGTVPEFSTVKERVKAALVSSKQEQMLAEQLEKLRKQSRVIVYYR